MGLLSDADASGEAKRVGINQHDWTLFYSDDYPKAIGVGGLSACSVVAVVSPHAAAVAHIGPNEFDSIDPNSFIELAKRLTGDVVTTCTKNHTQFPVGSKIHIVCATINSDVITAPEQLKAMYQGLKALPHSNVQWHHYEQSSEALINNQTHLGTVFIDGRDGIPRVYVEDRDVTDAPGISLTWFYNGQYQLKFGTAILEETASPPLNVWIRSGNKWIMWNGTIWTSS
jgi:hypothetical protein